jgi:hypothetical protein
VVRLARQTPPHALGEPIGRSAGARPEGPATWDQVGSLLPIHQPEPETRARGFDTGVLGLEFQSARGLTSGTSLLLASLEARVVIDRMKL